MLRITLILALLSTIGCAKSNPELPANRTLITRYEIEVGEPLSPEGLKESQNILDQLFGTADSPTIPSAIPTNIVTIDNLRRAAGPVSSNEQDVHFGLYRKHCVRCHGLAGDGRGPAARLLAPYPRDFRLGKFKFKSTPIGTKPTRQDLVKILRDGIPGTSMPSFHLLKDEDVEALADYVIYLSVRGETERALLHEVALELDTEAGQHLLKDHESAADSRFQKLAEDNLAKWNVPSQPDPQPPTDYPIFKPRDELDLDRSPQLAESIARGKELFQSKLNSCWLCHGDRGEGRVDFKDYDDWTKDWFVGAGLDPENRQSIAPMLKAGAFKPVPISARNLNAGVFRGGSSPSDVYYRIVHGIEGTPMPAAALARDVEGGLTEEQVWDLVNYCLSHQRHMPESPEVKSATIPEQDSSESGEPR